LNLKTLLKNRKSVFDFVIKLGQKKIGIEVMSRPLLGYTDAFELVKSNFNFEINYHTLRSFVIVNFGTKLKQPRKFLYKKDENAFENFKKNL